MGGSSLKGPPGYPTSTTPTIAKSLREYGNTSLNSYSSFEEGMLIFEMRMLIVFLLFLHLTKFCCAHAVPYNYKAGKTGWESNLANWQLVSMLRNPYKTYFLLFKLFSRWSFLHWAVYLIHQQGTWLLTWYIQLLIVNYFTVPCLCC